MPVTKDSSFVKERFAVVENAQIPGINKEEMSRSYTTWSDKFDEDMEHIQYNGDSWAADYLAKWDKNPDHRVLDVACGTGGVSIVLKKKHGYHNIDGLDGNESMLNMAREKNLYTNIFQCFIGDGNILPISDNTYDGAMMSGALLEGHLKCDSFLELIRVVKPGGYIVNVMREENRRRVPEFTKLEPLFKKWVAEGLWEKVEEVIPKEKYYMDLDGLVHVYRVLQNGTTH